MFDKKDIQKKLVDILNNENINTDEVLMLTSQLAESDDERVRFSVDGGLIERLGRELVAKQETALSELVKNCYDADATFVKVIFKNAEHEGGRLEIIDNGVGMSKEQLITGFMRISSTDKIDNPVSTKYSRQKAGRKGIGRFSTQRLGEQLIITTQTEDEDFAHRVTIDWNNIYKGNSLTSISFPIDKVSKERVAGTTLFIDNLREKWSEASIRRAYRYILELLQPFSISNIKEQDHFEYGFNVSFVREDNGKELAIADERTMIYDLAIAEILGEVDKSGNGIIYLKSKYVNQEPKYLQKEYKTLRNIRFKAFYFIHDKAYLSPLQLGQVKSMLNNIGGIRLYRNGFRVLPYGEQGNDWLGLDSAAKGRSGEKAPIGNSNFLGFVEVNDIEGIMFNETASREGLIENDAFRELIAFVYRAIEIGIEPRGQHHKKEERKNQINNELRSQIIRKNVEKIEKTFLEVLEKTNFSEEQKEEFKKTIPLLTSEIKQDIEENITETNALRVMASVGQSIGEFTHEIRQYMPKFQAQLGMIGLFIQGEKGRIALKKLSDYFINFKTYTSFFDETVSNAVIRELSPINLQKNIADFKAIIQNDLTKANIELEVEYLDNGKYITCKMHKSEWFSILMNFYSNARKAIAKKKRETDLDGKIKIQLSKKNNKIFISFMDNGYGILPQNHTTIFQPFWTTSLEDDFQGTGLGLSIVQTIINSYGGKVYVEEPNNALFSTSIKIEIPAFKEN